MHRTGNSMRSQLVLPSGPFTVAASSLSCVLMCVFGFWAFQSVLIVTYFYAEDSCFILISAYPSTRSHLLGIYRHQKCLWRRGYCNIIAQYVHIWGMYHFILCAQQKSLLLYQTRWITKHRDWSALVSIIHPNLWYAYSRSWKRKPPPPSPLPSKTELRAEQVGAEMINYRWQYVEESNKSV